MNHYVGIDVSLEYTSICLVDSGGKIVSEAKVETEPAVLIRWFIALELGLARIGLEAGPLSQFKQLKLEGCTEVQGYFFSPPRPASEVRTLMSALGPKVKAIA